MLRHTVVLVGLTIASLCIVSSGWARDVITIKVQGMADKALMPDEFAQCVPDATEHTRQGENRQPEVSWSAGPKGTKSYAIIMSDPDVPASLTEANEEGVTIESSAKRREFTHWIVMDIPATQTTYAPNSEGSEVVKYQGPCPPWNDMRMHNYEFVVVALDVASLKLPPKAEASDARAAMRGHILAGGTLTGIYSQNPDLRLAK